MSVELTVTILVFLTVLFGLVEFSYAFFQWNSATKATQLGARLAAVSDPVTLDILNITDSITGLNPGDPVPANSYNIVCDGAGSGSCTCSPSSGGLCPGSVDYEPDNMAKIVFGRCDPLEGCTVRSACNPNSSLANFGMCNVFSKVTPANVIVRYEHTGLGYVGRPSGRPVPTVSVELKEIEFEFVLLGGLMGFGSFNMPSFATTITGEDLNKGVF